MGNSHSDWWSAPWPLVPTRGSGFGGLAAGLAFLQHQRMVKRDVPVACSPPTPAFLGLGPACAAICGCRVHSHHEPPAQLTPRLTGHCSGSPTTCWQQVCRWWHLGALHGPTAQCLVLRPNMAHMLQGNETQECAGSRRSPPALTFPHKPGICLCGGSFLPETQPFTTLTLFCSLLFIQPYERAYLPPVEQQEEQ